MNHTEPTFVSYWDAEGKDVATAYAASTAKVISTVFQRNGAKDARIVADGRCVERWHDSRGNPLFAVFSSIEAHGAYVPATPESVRREQW